MASTYTLNNGIELIGTGEQSGTWGDTTNTNLELIDTALDGQISLTLSSAGSSGSPNALPVSDGASSNGRNRLISYVDGGDLGATAYVQLTPNDAEKIIYIRNALSGSRSIIVFQGTYNASNDYEIPAGTTAVVYFNGGGTGAVAANVFNNAHFDALNIVGAVAVGTTLTVGTSLNIASSTTVNGVLDEDNMASNSATKLSTQQSIKAYVDSQVGTVDTLAEVLANGNTTGGNGIVFSAGDNISNASGNLTLDVAGDIKLDADSGLVYLSDGGTDIGLFSVNNQDLNIRNVIADKDIYFQGNDGGSNFTAFTLDMSDAGTATFNNDIRVTGAIANVGATDFTIDVSQDLNLDSGHGDFYFKDGGSTFLNLYESSDDLYLLNPRSDGDIIFQGNDGGSTITALTLDMSDAGTATFNHNIKLPDNGVVQFGAGSDIAMYSDGTNGVVNVNNGNLTFDVAGDIILDADGADILFKDGGTEWLGFNSGGTMAAAGAFTLDVNGDIVLDSNNGVIDLKSAGNTFAKLDDESGHLAIIATQTNGDIIFKGNDDGSAATTLLTLDSSNAGAATFNGAITSGGNITVGGTNNLIVNDNGVAIFGNDGDLSIGNSGTIGLISAPNGDITLDTAGNINLDADGGNVRFKDGGTEYGTINKNGTANLSIYSSASDADILFQGNDGGSVITAMTIDMSAGGKVGIGDSSPSARLEIGGMAAGEQALLIQSGRNDALSNGLARINITDSNCPFVGLQVDHAGTGDAIKATGKIRATSFYGDGSNLTGVGGSTTYGAVGTYGIFHILPGTYVGVAAGGTTSASNLKNYVQSGYGGYPFQKFGTNGSDYSSASLSGTWRNMSGPLGVHSSDASNQMVGSIWVRIS